MSVESALHAAEPDHLFVEPETASESARGSMSSMTLKFLHLSSLFASGSDRQSVRKIEPRESATRNSLLVDGWEQTAVRGWGNGMG